MTQLSIPAPCSEKWSDMTPVRPDCRFCAACERQIVDFTVKTDEEILEHLKKNNGKICGRFRREQLNRPIRAVKSNARRGGLTAAAASIAALLVAQQPADIQSVVLVQTEQTPVDSHFKTGKVAPKQDSLRTISGKVVDADTEEGLKGVTVKLKNSRYKAVTDANGIFSFQIPLKKLQRSSRKIRLSCSGYKLAEFELPSRTQAEDVALIFSLQEKLSKGWEKKSEVLMGVSLFHL